MDLVVVLVVIVTELHIVLAVFLVVLDLHIRSLVGSDACMLQSKDLGLLFTDDRLSSFGGLFLSFLGCLGLFGGVVFLAAGEDLAGGGVDFVVVFVIAEVELHIVFAVFFVVFRLQDGGVCCGYTGVVQGDGLCFVQSDKGGFGGRFDYGHGGCRFLLIHIGRGAAGGQEEGGSQSENHQGLFHGRSLLSYFG